MTDRGEIDLNALADRLRREMGGRDFQTRFGHYGNDTPQQKCAIIMEAVVRGIETRDQRSGDEGEARRS